MASKTFPGIYKAVVVDNNDPENFGRLRVQVHQVMGGATLNWAWPNLTNVVGAQVGIPAVGSGVWVQFEGGDPDFPVWTGTWQIQGNIAALQPPTLPGQRLPVPPPPRGIQAIAGDGTVTLTWVAPTGSGQAPVTSYTITSIPPAPQSPITTHDATVTQVIFENLVNGTPYEFSVVANSDSGPSDPIISSQVTPSGLPLAWPSAPVASVLSATSLTLWWPIPPDNGSVIAYYTVTISPGGGQVQVFGEKNNSTIWSNLTTNQPFSFTVQAVNGNGAGPVSASSNTATPQGTHIPPGPPTNVNAVASTSGAAQATISFTPPAVTGTGTITGYTVTVSPGGATATGTGSPITITGLTYGTQYTFTVTATGDGTSVPSSASNAVTPAAPPNAPTGLTAIAKDGKVVLDFAAPANNGSPITQYTGTATPDGATGTSIGSPPTSRLTINNLTDGVTYTLSVTATNALGTSAPSSTVTAIPLSGSPTPSNLATTAAFPAPTLSTGSKVSPSSMDTTASFIQPTAIIFNVGNVAPSAPLNVTPHVLSSTSIKLNWNTPTTGSTPFTYSISGNFPGSPVTVGSGPSGPFLAYTFPNNLTPNTTYNFTVTASNSAGSASATPVSAKTSVSGTVAPSLQQGWVSHQTQTVNVTAALAAYFDFVGLWATQATPNMASVKTDTAVAARGTQLIAYMKGGHIATAEYSGGWSSTDPGPGNSAAGTPGTSVGGVHQGFFSYDGSSNLLGHTEGGGFNPMINPKSPEFQSMRATTAGDVITGHSDIYWASQYVSQYFDGVFLDVEGDGVFGDRPKGVTTGNYTPYINGQNSTAYNRQRWYNDMAAAAQNILSTLQTNVTKADALSVMGNGLTGPSKYNLGTQTAGWPNVANSISDASATSATLGMPNGIGCMMEEAFMQSGGSAASLASKEVFIISDYTSVTGNVWYGLAKVWNGCPYNPRFVMALVMVAHNGFNSSILAFEFDKANPPGFSYDPVTDTRYMAYYPSFPTGIRLALGDPTGAPSTMIKQGTTIFNTAYGREYTSGFVICNPTTSAINFSMPSTTLGHTYVDFFNQNAPGYNPIAGSSNISVPPYVVDPRALTSLTPTWPRNANGSINTNYGELSSGGYLFLLKTG